MGRQKARKPRRPRPESRRPEFSTVYDPQEELAFARAMRSSCDFCGSRHLHWGDVAGGVWTARTDDQRARFTEAVAEGISTQFVAWWCMECDNLGIFLAPELM